MERVTRFLLSLVKGLINFQTDLLLLFYKLVFKKLKIKKHAKFNGIPFLRPFGKTEIGSYSVFNSTTQYNTVGLFKNCSIFVSKNAELKIGERSGFSGVSIHCQTSISIGNDCNFGGNVSIWDTDFHSLDYIERRRVPDGGVTSKPIVIGNDVFVGANSIILKGVIIGDRAVIGAGSVVTKDIKNNEIWAGNPAKFIRLLNNEMA